MKQCLQCKMEFESKRDAGKFCSDKCRVKWHRKNPKKEEVQKIQMQVLYNEMVDILSEIKASLNTPLPKNLSDIKSIEIKPSHAPIRIKRSFGNYQQLRIDCQNEEDWLSLKEEILNSDLSQKQKIILTT